MSSAEPTWGGHHRGSREYRRILIGLGAAGVATFAQLHSPQALLTVLSADLHAAPSDVALTVSLAMLGVALAVVPWSWAADRFGRLTAMKVAIAASAVLGVLTAFSPFLEVLLTLRFLEGLALGGLPALAMTYLHDEIDARFTAAAAAVYIAGTSVGGMSGRLVAGFVAGFSGWRPGLAVVALLCVGAAAVFFALMPSARGHVARKVSLGDVSRGVLDCLRDRGLVTLYLTAFALFGGFVAVYNYLAFRLEGPGFGLPVTVVSWLFVSYLAGTFSAAWAGRLVPRFGRFATLVGSTVVMAAGLFVMLASNLWMVIAGLLVFTAGFFGAHSVASSWVGERAKPSARAQATALYNVFYYSGSAVIGWAVGFAWVAFGWVGVVAPVAVACAVALVAAVLTERSRRRPAAA